MGLVEPVVTRLPTKYTADAVCFHTVLAAMENARGLKARMDKAVVRWERLERRRLRILEAHDEDGWKAYDDLEAVQVTANQSGAFQTARGSDG